MSTDPESVSHTEKYLTPGTAECPPVAFRSVPWVSVSLLPLFLTRLGPYRILSRQHFRCSCQCIVISFRQGCDYLNNSRGRLMRLIRYIQINFSFMVLILKQIHG